MSRFIIPKSVRVQFTEEFLSFYFSNDKVSHIDLGLLKVKDTKEWGNFIRGELLAHGTLKEYEVI